MWGQTVTDLGARIRRLDSILRQRGAIEDFEVGREPRYRYDQLASSSKTEQPMTGAWVGTGSGGGQKREGLRQVSVYSSKEGGHLGEF